jgi:hypothetical protein
VLIVVEDGGDDDDDDDDNGNDNVYKPSIEPMLSFLSMWRDAKHRLMPLFGSIETSFTGEIPGLSSRAS